MRVEYRVVYSERRAISLTVERDRSIVVHAPIGTSEEKIRQLVEAKKLWLYKKVNDERKYPLRATRKEFVTGESLMYLGRYYGLQITDDDAPGVRFQGRFYISRRQRSRAAQVLTEWYTQRAREKLTPRVRHFARSLGVAFGKIRVSDVKYRWASCTPLNNLNFNWRLIKAPMFVIDYVIVHELAHLREANHTPEFWNIVAVQVPGYRRAQDWLRENGAVLEEDL